MSTFLLGGVFTFCIHKLHVNCPLNFDVELHTRIGIGNLQTGFHTFSTPVQLLHTHYEDYHRQNFIHDNHARCIIYMVYHLHKFTMSLLCISYHLHKLTMLLIYHFHKLTMSLIYHTRTLTMSLIYIIYISWQCPWYMIYISWQYPCYVFHMVEVKTGYHTLTVTAWRWNGTCHSWQHWLKVK